MSVHEFKITALRLGVIGAREVPSCYPKSPITDESGTYWALLAGVDIGDATPRLRVQTSVRFSGSVEMAFGLGVSF